MPFITEEIWQHLPGSGQSLVVASFPHPKPELIKEDVETSMKLLQEAIVGVRTIRAENRIAPQVKIELWLKVDRKKDQKLIEDHQLYFQTLANIRKVYIWDNFPPERKLLKGVAGCWEIAIPFEPNLIDLEQEEKRVKKELAKIDVEIVQIEKRLRNKNFLRNAPQDIIMHTKNRLQALRSRKSKLEENLNHLLSLQ